MKRDFRFAVLCSGFSVASEKVWLGQRSCNAGLKCACHSFSIQYGVHIWFAFLIVRLNCFQVQILFFNILDFSDFSEIFLYYFEKSPKSVSTDIDNWLYDFLIHKRN